MRKLGLAIVALALAGFVSGPAMAHHNKGGHAGGAETGNGGPSGPHFNLNIIGVAVDKESAMTGSKRHTIFVALDEIGGGGTKTDIWLVQGDFQVCDGNGFDTAFDCDGTFLKNVGTLGAVFQLPCNDAIDGEEDCTGFSTAYEVWVRELGAPGGTATMQICADDGGGRFCSTESVVLVRSTGKSSFRNVTNELTSICIDDPAGGNPCDLRFALFTGTFVDWVWEYTNKGLRLAQLRFYVID